MPCADPAPWLLPISCDPLGRTTSGFGSHSPNSKAEGDVLCPGLLLLQKASCATLADTEAVAELLAPLVRQPVCCKLGWSGFVSHRDARELADLLVGLGATLTSRHGPEQPLRYVATNAGNGWEAMVAATYLQRVLGGPLHGLVVGAGKSEWAQSGDARKLQRMLGLSYRMQAWFEADAELALLSHDPTPNRMIMPHIATFARALLPPRHHGEGVPPFDVCLRVGSPLNLEALHADWARGDLAAHCGAFAFWSGGRAGARGGGERVAAAQGGTSGDDGGGAADDGAAGEEAQQLQAVGPRFHLAAFLKAVAAAGANGGAIGAQPPKAAVRRAGNWTIVTAEPTPFRFDNHWVAPPPPPRPPPRTVGK